MAPSLSPPGLLPLLANPLRWRLVNELSRSDRRVHELTAAVSEPQNLVSYHLGRLRRAGVVTGRRSSADGRDTYYALDLARLRSDLITAGADLHPGLRLAPAVRSSEGSAPEDPAGRSRVLFLCTGNSARSKIAAALTAHRSSGRVTAASAGSRPKALHPNTRRALREEYGIDLGETRPTHVDDLTGQDFDRVITLCDRVREVCPEFPGDPEAAHWSIADPAADVLDDEASYPAFVATAAELDRRIEFLLAELTDPLLTTNRITKEHR